MIKFDTYFSNPFFVAEDEEEMQLNYYNDTIEYFMSNGLSHSGVIYVMEEQNYTPKTILDLGSNIGTQVIPLCFKYPDTQIIAVEPNPKTYKILKQNLSYYPNATALRYGIYNKTKTVAITSRVRHSGNQITSWNSIGGMLREDIITNGISIIDLINTYNLHNIDIIIIDIEGSEKYLFPELFTVCKNLNWLHLETHDMSLFCYCYSHIEKHLDCKSLSFDSKYLNYDKDRIINPATQVMDINKFKTFSTWARKTNEL